MKMRKMLIMGTALGLTISVFGAPEVPVVEQPKTEVVAQDEKPVVKVKRAKRRHKKVRKVTPVTAVTPK